MNQAIEFIKKYSSFAVAAHKNPEGDAIGATLAITRALADMGKAAHPFNGDPAPPAVWFLPGSDKMISRTGDLPRVEAVIVLDCGDRDRPGEDFKNFMHGKPVLNIDHHQTNSGFGDVNWVEPEASSTGEMLAEMLKAMKAEVSSQTAICLYTAMLTDTGSFQYSNTSPNTLRMAADMIEAGADPALAAQNYYHKKPASHLMLLARCLQTLEFNQSLSRGDALLTSEMFQDTGTGPEAAEGIVNVIVDVETVKVAILFRQLSPEKWKASMRSKGEIDVAKLAREYGGGGHKNAAGAALEGQIEKLRPDLCARADRLIEKV